jgi:hypothetical protein
MALATNFRLGWKCQSETNTLAYYKHSQIVDLTKFYNILPCRQEHANRSKRSSYFDKVYWNTIDHGQNEAKRMKPGLSFAALDSAMLV